MMIFIALVVSTTAICIQSQNASAASNICDIHSIPAETRKSAGCKEVGGENVTIEDIIQNILTTIIVVSGTIAVVFVIVGGVKYITSSGNPAEIEKARKTIIYALIGLAVCTLAFVIVNFVVSAINRAN